MRPEDRDHLEIWKNTTLAGITSETSATCEEFRDDIKKFSALATVLGKRALNGFLKTFGFLAEAELDTMDDDLKNAYTLHIVSALNAGLPINYPFVVAIVFSEPTPKIKMCVLRRSIIPGAHEMTSPRIIPILCIKNVTLYNNTALNVKIVDAEHIPNDNLEDLFRL